MEGLAFLLRSADAQPDSFFSCQKSRGVGGAPPRSRRKFPLRQRAQAARRCLCICACAPADSCPPAGAKGFASEATFAPGEGREWRRLCHCAPLHAPRPSPVPPLSLGSCAGRRRRVNCGRVSIEINKQPVIKTWRPRRTRQLQLPLTKRRSALAAAWATGAGDITDLGKEERSRTPLPPLPRH